MIAADPVPYLPRPFADAGMQPGRAQNGGLLRTEDPVGEILVEIEFAACGAQAFDPGLQGFRLLPRPGHPWQEMIDVLIDGLLQQGHVRRIPAPEYEVGRLDTVGRSGYGSWHIGVLLYPLGGGEK